jgi:hypothetical protein
LTQALANPELKDREKIIELLKTGLTPEQIQAAEQEAATLTRAKADLVSR